MRRSLRLTMQRTPRLKRSRHSIRKPLCLCIPHRAMARMINASCDTPCHKCICYMIWSKTKRAIESLLAVSVKKHVQFHMTRYGLGVSQTMARAWITWDGQEIANLSNAEWAMETYAVQNQQNVTYAQAQEIIRKTGLLSRFDFESAVQAYLGSSIEHSLQSDDPIMQAFALFDRRTGKRRLAQFCLATAAHPLVKVCYHLRCQAEGLPETNA